MVVAKVISISRFSLSRKADVCEGFADGILVSNKRVAVPKQARLGSRHAPIEVFVFLQRSYYTEIKAKCQPLKGEFYLMKIL